MANGFKAPIGVLMVNGPPSALNSFRVFFFLVSVTDVEVLAMAEGETEAVSFSPLAPESPVTDNVAERVVVAAAVSPEPISVLVFDVVRKALVVATKTRHVKNGMTLMGGWIFE